MQNQFKEKFLRAGHLLSIILLNGQNLWNSGIEPHVCSLKSPLFKVKFELKLTQNRKMKNRTLGLHSHGYSICIAVGEL